MRIEYFSATWCGPCKMFKPVFQEFMAGRPDIAVEFVDLDEEPSRASNANVASVPSIVVYNDAGAIVGTLTGAMPMAKLRAALEPLLEA